MLVVIAAPTDLDTYKLGPILPDEIQNIKQFLVSINGVETTILTSGTNNLPTLDNIRRELLEGYHFFYLLAHGRHGKRSGGSVFFLGVCQQ